MYKKNIIATIASLHGSTINGEDLNINCLHETLIFFKKTIGFT